jgi:hypothetical protein
MTLVIIRMKVLSEKRMELSQAIVSLIGSIRTEKGCNRCDFCQGVEDENRLCKVRGEFVKHCDDVDVCTRCGAFGLIELEGVTEHDRL